MWFIAGANVALIGIQVFLDFDGLALAALGLGALAIFIGFFAMFRRMVVKHTKRINAYDNQPTSIFNFFDRRGYVIMAAMMTFGFGARALGIFPDWFIAFFYTGLGIALAAAGALFFCNYFCPQSPTTPTASASSG